jgi:hypothetical protein
MKTKKHSSRHWFILQQLWPADTRVAVGVDIKFL